MCSLELSQVKPMLCYGHPDANLAYFWTNEGLNFWMFFLALWVRCTQWNRLTYFGHHIIGANNSCSRWTKLPNTVWYKMDTVLPPLLQITSAWWHIQWVDNWHSCRRNVCRQKYPMHVVNVHRHDKPCEFQKCDLLNTKLIYFKCHNICIPRKLERHLHQLLSCAEHAQFYSNCSHEY